MSSMSDFDAERARTKPGQPFKLDVILAELDPERARSLREALADHRYSSGVISRTVRRWGWTLDESSVRKWRHRHLT